MKNYILTLLLVIFVQLLSFAKPPCTATVGTITVTGATLKSGNEYDLADGSSVSITATGYSMPTGSHSMSYAYFSCDPGVLSGADLLDLNNNSCYLGSESKATTTDPNTGGISSGGLKSLGNFSTLWIVPYSRYGTSGGVVDDGTGCYAIGTTIKVNYLTAVIPPLTCSSCASATCKVVVSTGTTLTLARSQCTADMTSQTATKKNVVNLSDNGVSKTICVPVTVPSDASKFGFKHGFNGANGACVTSDPDIIRSYTLVTANCAGPNIAPKATNGGGVGSGFNPEWDVVSSSPGAGQLVPGNYVFCFTIKINSGSLCTSVPDLILGAYSNGTIPVTPPCPTEKTYISLDWAQTNPFISWSAKNYTCSSPTETVYKNVDINTISTGGQIQPFPGFKMDMTMNSGADTKTSILVSVNGVPYSYYGPTGTAPSGVLDWGQVATSGQQIMEPFIPKGATVTLTVCDTRATNQSFPYTVWDYATGNTLTTGTATPKSGSCSTITFTLTSPTMTWKIDGSTTGVTDNNNGSCTFDPKALSAGNHTLQYTFDNGSGCTVTANLESFTTAGGPTITPATPISVCAGTTSTTFTYSSTGTPTKYSIDWNTTANNVGFVDVVDAALTASPQTITLPAGAAAATYTGSLTVKNAGGCSSVPQNITVTLTSGPTITGTATLCVGATTQLSGSGTANTTNPWLSATTANATVNATGLVTGVAAGTSVITYKDNNGCTATQTVTVNGNPTLTATPTSILTAATSAIAVTGGSGTAATTNAWQSSSTATATIVGAGQTATVTGVAAGNTNIIYTDDKGCDDTVQVSVTIPGCQSINNPSSDQVWCQGIDPAALTVSTSETASNGINFVVYPAITKPANAAQVYSGVGTLGVSIQKVTPASGVASLDLPALGTLGSLPVTLAGDYYVYAILDPVPSDVNCRPYAEIKVTIKDSIKPTVTTSSVVGNSTTFEWNNVTGADKWGVKGAITPTNTTPTTWMDLGSIAAAVSGTKNTHTTNLIPLGSTAHINITPQDISGVQLACSNSASASIQNPNCTKPVPATLSLSVPSVCEGGSISVVGGVDAVLNTVPANFKWRIALDGVNWTDVSGADYDLSTPTTLTIPVTKIGMNNALVRLVVIDQATGACSDSTAPIALKINEIPNATISISPDPALLCVGANQLITVTMMGSKGIGPYVFDYTLDGTANIDSSLAVTGTGVLSYEFDTDKPIDDSTFVLTKVTDKNGCFKNITSNNTVKMQVIDSPKPVFVADQTIGCYPFEVIFTDKSTNLNTNVEWDFGDGSPVLKDLGSVKYVFKKAGDYTITFKSTLNGCSGTMEKKDYIQVKDRPIADFTPNQTDVHMVDTEVKFENKSSKNAVSYKWFFGDNSPVVFDKNPSHKYVGDGPYGLPEAKKYDIVLYAYVNKDCYDSTLKSITIYSDQIYYIPNSFTPNGDAKNNTFQPIFYSGFDAQNYHFSIFNRWGELIFESYNPAIGWDGTYGNNILQNGSYVWKLQFKEDQSEVEHYLTGSVNLIK